MIYLVLLLLFPQVKSNDQDDWTNITVTNTNCSRCYPDQQNQMICCSLNEASSYIKNNTYVMINETVSLTSSGFKLPINNKPLNFLYIEGMNNGTIKCKNNGRLFFHYIKNFYIINLTIRGCGEYINKTHEEPAVKIASCKNVNIVGVTVEHSRAVGMKLSDTAGNVAINNSNFQFNFFECPNNETFSKKYYRVGGGGVSINFENFTDSAIAYNISWCKFTSNHKLTDFNCKNISDSEKHKKPWGFAHGGGLEIKLNETSNVSVNIENSEFSNNTAYHGGGAAVLLQGKANHITVKFANCNFSSNIANSSVIPNGGGLQILFIAHNTQNNSIAITNCTFSDNWAYFGGGMSIASGSNLNYYHSNSLIIKNCTWQKNKATSGAAVDASHHFSEDRIASNIIKPVFVDCKFVNNSLSYNKSLKEAVGFGALSVTMMNVQFSSSVIFQRNNGSAISATRAILEFIDCNASFTNNIGINGGAILFMGFASMNFSTTNDTKSGIMFSGNHALNNGGAIYSIITDDHLLFGEAGCPFIFNTPEKKIFEFINNTADNHGSNIYLSSITPCGNINKTLMYLKCEKQHCRKEINTAPTTYKYDTNNGTRLKVYSGEMTLIENLVFFDGLNKSKMINNITLQAYVLDNPKLKLKHNYILNNQFIITGPENENASILLQTIEKPILNVIIQVETKPCPPGYIYSEENSICICAAEQFYGIHNCTNGDKYRTFITNNIWYGYIPEGNGNKTTFYTGPCHWYCNHKYDFYTEIDFNAEKNSLCSHYNRRSILCGKCLSNYSVYYHSNIFKCEVKSEKCGPLGWLFFILSELLPLTMILIVIILTGFNITSGYVQGFLLYSHILSSLSLHVNGIIKTNSFLYKLFKFSMEMFYMPLDLKFFHFPGMDYCIFKNAKSTDVAALGYFKGIFGFGLIFIIIGFLKFFSGHCNRCVRFTTARNSALLGMSALLVLSFTSAMEVALLLLQPAPLYARNYTKIIYKVALLGEETYFDEYHLRYAIPALVFIVVMMIPVMMLLLYPLVSQLLFYFRYDADHSCQGIVLTKCFFYYRMKPFYDKFYADFKDRHRYFAGLYLIYRAIIQLCYFLPNFTVCYFIMEAFLIIFLIAHSIIQPYKKQIHNVIDGILLGLLVVINGLTCANMVVIYSSIHRYFWNVKAAAIFQIVFALIPMYFVLLYVTYKYVLMRFWRYLKSRRGDYYQLVNSATVPLYHNRPAMQYSIDFS